MSQAPDRTRELSAKGPAPHAAPLEVAAAVLFRDGRLLITQRRAEDPLGGFWEFPGGKREPGETFEACLQRELKEELDLDIAPGELLDTVQHVYPDKTVMLKFFRCSCPTGQPKTIGCQAVAWVKPDELRRYQFPAADEKLLDLLQRRPDLWK